MPPPTSPTPIQFAIYYRPEDDRYVVVSAEDSKLTKVFNKLDQALRHIENSYLGV